MRIAELGGQQMDGAFWIAGSARVHTAAGHAHRTVGRVTRNAATPRAPDGNVDNLERSGSSERLCDRRPPLQTCPARVL